MQITVELMRKIARQEANGMIQKQLQSWRNICLMETLKWCVRTDLAVENTPEIMEVKFGDGYTQRSPKGLNNLLRAYTGTIKVKKGNI
ncbi:Phage-related protein [Mannheimia haemolytica]|uniref:Phage-related protein n=1 Tax=Mannheimia haemolytica TaxID=75985 RepID=A0A378MU03_MANHA|nr:Phage-related protein [Mannheimia haemolytica]